MFLRVLRAFVVTLLFTGCIADPELPAPPDLTGIDAGIIIVNEGVWRQDNATLTLYDQTSDASLTDWFAAANTGQRIGDTGNEIAIRGDRAYVVVSESSTIEAIALPSGASLGRVRLPAGTSPRSVAILNDSIAWVTGLDADAVYQWNPAALTLGMKVDVGPAPEGVAIMAGRLFVANSGLGKLRAGEPGAGTISVIDPISGARLDTIDVGGNLRDLHAMPGDGLLYAFIGAPLPDTSGSGLVAIDPVTLTVLHRWSIPAAWEVGFDDVAVEAYVIAAAGVIRIPFRFSSGLGSPTRDTVVRGPLSTLSEEVPHSIAISPFTGEILIGMARGYFQAPGRVDRYDRDGRLIGSFTTGLNPTAMGFVR